MGDPAAGTHALHITRANHRTVTHTVLVLQGAVKHIADDLHIAVAMGAESRPRGHGIVIDHPQIRKTHVPRVMIATEGKGVVAIEPAMICVAAFFRSS